MKLVTSNIDKWREAERILGTALERVSLDLPELQAATTASVALEKVRAAFDALGDGVIVEDAGVELLALGGFPGPYIKWWEKTGGLTSICRALDTMNDRRAVAVCCLGVARASELFVVEGRCEGTISLEPRGTNGFGWDAIFIPQGETRTFGEMSAAEKDAVSHRRRAWEALRATSPP
ncbi:MAG: RdgB/HAM1 family non-canonical purine NTP pyrophosphatase [Polyangiaceae bacterium]